ncbi:cation diffusion facilitator family transporter [Hymenobacter psychrotolerans]|uniref:Cation diffusion facilitator family transporter n=1 Tax=Hymenobacter psychrotolerans DSM 18569 TaxID=1121959 RepID=A0A1M7H6K9_9BACT|nr:cation diffusion facilitator family transporter [Hymenobacter psychrotolerans]SHM24241.1 cation diffusion facilitator family transporter [Hymenobacter psychrotolerans DSM 18569]
MEQSAGPTNRERAERGQTSTLWGIGANVALVLGKGTAGVLGHSYALIADAIESATDIISSGIVWLGLRTAAREPDENHPYGHGKAEPLAALLVAGALMAAAGFIAYESILRIQTPHQLPARFTLGVLAVVIVIKEFLYRRVLRVGKEVDSAAVKADAWHHRADAITSCTAFVGISIALLGGPGYESADDWAALVACCFIVYNAYHIFRPAFGEIMDEAPEGTWTEDIRALAEGVPGVVATEKCFVRKMGLEFFADLHVIVDGSISVREGHAIAHAVKAAIMQAKPAVYNVLVHIEPAS